MMTILFKMNRYMLLCTLSAMFVACTKYGTESHNQEIQVPDHPWFTVSRITKSVFRIDDHGNDNLYIVLGRDSALLIDTGIGAVDLPAFIGQITSLPVIVVNTHGHPDHVGSNNQFTQVYAHPSDMPMVTHFTTPAVQKGILQYLVRTTIPDSLRFNDSLRTASLRSLKDGHVFDLGGDRRVEVIHVPGHTAGSICLLDHQEKVLFTGDHVKELAWLHTEEALSLESYLASLRKLAHREKEFSILLSGHGEPLDKMFLHEQIACVENIIAGNCTGEVYESVVGNGLVCSYKRAKVAYQLNKIRQ